MERICPHCGYEGSEARCPNDDFPTVDPTHFALKEGVPDLTGQVLADRYHIESHLGDGATGWVFKSKHLSTKQHIAVKILRRDLTRKMVAIRRFYSEARACANLAHPNIIRVFDFGATEDGYLYMAMEYLEGESLQDRVKRLGPCLPETAMHIGKQIAAALELAHDAGIIHRDLKPANIHMCSVGKKTDVVKILDFGLAKAIGDEKLEVGITAAGFLVGSPGYIAPEQVMGHPADGRADLYALGVTLYRILTGQLPFLANTAEELIKQQMTRPPRPLPKQVDGHPIPPTLAALVMHLLALKPDDRFQTAGEVLAALRDIEAGRTPAFMAHYTPLEDVETHDEQTLNGFSIPGRGKGRRWQWAALAAGLLVLVAMGVGGVLSGDDAATTSLPVVTGEETIEADTEEQPEEAAAPAEVDAAEPAEQITPVAVVPEPAAALAERLILVNSTPQGAEIRSGGIVVGTTPMNVPLVEGRTRQLTLLYPGDGPRKVTLGGETPETVTVVFDTGPPPVAEGKTITSKAGKRSKSPTRSKKKRRPRKKKGGLKIKVL